MACDRPQPAPEEISRLRAVADELTEFAARRQGRPFAFGDRIVVGRWSVDTSGLRTYED
ncbi:hypothetical protein [Streptacidiphilus melanogenes]|uniref:hypothetical protein n=1 Tax=Streptacidiphilus melanogenes TaxID=411235 RepID=UPI000AC34486|nr:hypothetical protein [Streptacidiphilus melanogenes]